MESFTVKLEGPVGCGKDTFMQLVEERLKDEYNIVKTVFATTFVDIWNVEQKNIIDIYSKISEVTGLSRSDVKRVIQAFTYTIEHD